MASTDPARFQIELSCSFPRTCAMLGQFSSKVVTRAKGLAVLTILRAGVSSVGKGNESVGKGLNACML